METSGNASAPALPFALRRVVTCLDAIDSCDVFLIVLGGRGGWKTPSGRLVIEEEFEHARSRKLAVLVFFEDRKNARTDQGRWLALCRYETRAQPSSSEASGIGPQAARRLPRRPGPGARPPAMAMSRRRI